MCGLECYAAQEYRWSAPDVAEGLNACRHRRKRAWQATPGCMCGLACYVLQKHHCRAAAMAEESTVRLHHLHLAALSHAWERARYRDVDVRLWVRLARVGTGWSHGRCSPHRQDGCGSVNHVPREMNRTKEELSPQTHVCDHCVHRQIVHREHRHCKLNGRPF